MKRTAINTGIFLLILSWLLLIPIIASAQDHGHDEHAQHDEHGHADHHDDHPQISPDRAQELGITTAVAAPGTISSTITVYGPVTTAPEKVSHIRARFPGLITEVAASVGDTVSAGDTLAKVESNDSLNVYDVRSPLAGTITERHANTGESTLDRVLFTVASLDPLWAELKVFPTQRAQVSPGDSVLLIAGDLRHTTTVRHLLPSDGQPFIRARVQIDNPGGRWTPGLVVEAEIQTNTIEAEVVVNNDALQTLEGNTVVFVVEDDGFAPRPIKTDRRDRTHTEVLEGLHGGETYAVENSYLIKADIEKSSAEHHH